MRRFLLNLLACAGLTGAVLTASPTLLQAAVEAPAQPVSLRPEVVVDGPVLKLGDFFEGLDEQAGLNVAQAPVPGARIRVSLQWLQRLARSHDLAWQPQPGLASVTVRRSSQVVGQMEIQDALSAALGREGIGDDLDVVLDNPGITLHLALGAPPEIQVTALSYDPRSERLAAKLLVRSDGQRPVEAVIRGRALHMTELPVLRHRVAFGQVITADDLDWTRLPSARLGRGTLTDPADIVGKSPRRMIRPGRQLRRGDLQAPVVVAKNSLVTLRLETPVMRLSAQGRALENGGLGDVVRVVNTKSKALVYGLVTGPNNVVVTDPSQTHLHQEASR